MKTHAGQKVEGTNCRVHRSQARQVSKWSQLIRAHRIRWCRPGAIEEGKPLTSPWGPCHWQVYVHVFTSYGSRSRVAREGNIWSSPQVGNPDFYVTIIDCGMFVTNTTFYSFIVRTKHLFVQCGHLGHWFVMEKKTRAVDLPGNKVQQNRLLAM